MVTQISADIVILGVLKNIPEIMRARHVDLDRDRDVCRELEVIFNGLPSQGAGHVAERVVIVPYARCFLTYDSIRAPEDIPRPVARQIPLIRFGIEDLRDWSLFCVVFQTEPHLAEADLAAQLPGWTPLVFTNLDRRRVGFAS